MKAAVIEAYQQPMPTLKQVAIPTPRPNDVLVQIVAASINPIDLKTKDGGLRMLLKYDMPLIMGSDFSGVVTAIGESVSTYHVGDVVYGRVQKNRIGTFAEFIAVDQGDIALKPANMTFEEAASIPLVGLTSYQALHDIMAIRPGQKVLIQGGSGGIGSIAIQIAKHMGAYVATTTSADHFALVRALGADELIDYRTTDFSKVLADYDFVLDTRGGQTLADAFKIIRPGGQIVSIAGLPNARFGREYGVPLWKRWAFGVATRQLTKLEKQTGATYTFLFMKPSGAELETLRQLIEHGVIHAVIDRVVPFDQIESALTYSKSGQAAGKIILKMTTQFDQVGARE
ncbi:NADP-dependent oxidoreductase [Lacticaseibacillus daqingensis]|uniref:NADP-dependent oxidoreductase n=1 Tax=Lacticaseibacillus daqingensis TaxID=2486014 RepID=UPI00178710CB|nr:NADP-dependent oxidoreductase [Lacticaseibacillus daqingensis]